MISEGLDLAAFRWLAGLRDPCTTLVIRAYSRLGEYGLGWYALGLAGMALDRAGRRRWRRGTASVLAAQLGAAAVKQVVRRRRPAIEGLDPLVSTPTGLSFPSSHAATSLAAARAFAPLVGARAIYPPAVLMALTRVHLGVHYPSDVLAGAALGAVIGSFGR